MPDPGSFPLADVLASFNSVLVILVLGVVFLVLWQVAILLGALIASMGRPASEEEPEEIPVG